MTPYSGRFGGLLLTAGLVPGLAGASVLPVESFLDGRPLTAPVANTAFAPGSDARDAPAFRGKLHIHQTTLEPTPSLEQPVVGGRDARLFPAVTLSFVTVKGVLAPLEAGEMVRESGGQDHASYWRVIPQYGHVWTSPADHGWARAAFPIILVNDTENHAHQGLASFLYRDGQVTGLRMQFVQQTAPYVLRPHFVATGFAHTDYERLTDDAAGHAQAIDRELAGRLPLHPLQELRALHPAGALDGFGGPIFPKWRVMTALVLNGTIYYEDAGTPAGPFPYPAEMRFGVRSVMKSVAGPLALLRLAEVYGPWVLSLRIGAFVPGLDPKWDQVRFIDAASMASGFGGTGTLKTAPNDIFDGYLGGNYDDWYLAPSHAEKIRQIRASLTPYPWAPGTVVRYRDQDLYLLGAAVDAFLKSVRGPDADIWRMLREEVFEPIGIHHAPAVHTQEAGGREGLVWFNAGYYPSIDDLAKIALLYQHRGRAGGRQILNPALTEDLLAGRGALPKARDISLSGAAQRNDPDEPLYFLGFHYTPYVSSSGRHWQLPTMAGSGENEVVLFPNGAVAIRIAKAANLPAGEQPGSSDATETLRAVDRIAPF